MNREAMGSVRAGSPRREAYGRTPESGQPPWALSWALCGLTWIFLTPDLFVRPASPTQSCQQSYAIRSTPGEEALPCGIYIDPGLHEERGNEPGRC